MARLEYRLLDEQQSYPVLYGYDRIDKKEAALRFACDYFIKEGKVYAKTSCAVEGEQLVIYVTEEAGEKAGANGGAGTARWNGVRLEIREYGEARQQYPLLTTMDFSDMHDVLLYLQSDYIYIGEREWAKSSTEVDEDRKLYVLYVGEAEQDGGQ